ncbi:MAG TPA: DNA cytosine methyltransferase [Candidatus Rokubacteria bacterium]|nr:DNA cytosine methyltransferase [Candidatus Rokubacteria bacterium]
MNALSLCSGVEGIGYGLKRVVPGYRTVCYVEADPYCQDVLIRRMEDGWLDCAPIWPDLRTFDGRPWRGRIDLVHAGFPCQPFSVAGKRRGADDARNLWPDVRRIVAESDPRVVFLENVPGALPYFFHVVLPELHGLGYVTACRLVTAAEVGAPHRRQRVFVLAHRERPEWRAEAEGRNASGGHDTGRKETTSWASQCRGTVVGEPERARRKAPGVRRDEHTGNKPETGRGVVVHPDEPRLAVGFQPEVGCGDLRDEGPPAWPPSPEERDRWAAVLARWPDLAPATEAQLPLRRVADGRARRVDRLRALGNAVVPAQAARAWELLTRCQ